MLNLKSDPGLNYLLKFQDFICAIRRERHLQPLRIQGWMEGCLWQGHLPLNQLTAMPAIICPRWPHFVSYLASYKYLHRWLLNEWEGRAIRSSAELFCSVQDSVLLPLVALPKLPVLQRVWDKPHRDGSNGYDFHWNQIKLHQVAKEQCIAGSR